MPIPVAAAIGHLTGRLPGNIAPVAVDDGPHTIQPDTGTQSFQVLDNDTYSGTPDFSIVSQSGPVTATTSGSGATKTIDVDTTGAAEGTVSVTYELTATGNTGSDQATLTVEIVAAAAGDLHTGTASSEGNPSNDLTPAYATGVAFDSGWDHYLQVSIYAPGGGQGVTPPTGYVIVASHTTGDIHQWIMYRQGDGAEPASISVPWTANLDGGVPGTRLAGARIYSVRNHTREDATGTSTSGSGTSITAATQTLSTGTLALLFSAIRVPDDNDAPTVTDITGESSGDWIEQFEERRIHSNHGMTLNLFSATASSSGGTATASLTGDWATTAIAAGASTDIGGGEGTQPPSSFDVIFDVDAAPYSAAGDGSTDDASAIQSMFNDVEAHHTNNPNDVIGMQFGAGKRYAVGQNVTINGAANFHFLGTSGNRPTIERHSSFDLTLSGRNKHMLSLVGCDNWGMWDFDFDGRRDLVAPVDEFGHVVSVIAGEGGSTVRCDFINGQGDGLILTRNGINPDGTSATMVLDFYSEDCKRDNNHRNNMSVIYCHGGTFLRDEFTNANGTPPEEGVDCEPTVPNDGTHPAVAIKDLVFRKCLFKGNTGPGLNFGGRDGANQNIEVDACTFEENALDSTDPVRGHIFFRNCDGSIADSMHVHDCVFKNLTTPPGSGETKSVMYFHNLSSPSALIENNQFFGNTGASVLIMFRDLGESPNQIKIHNNDLDISAGLTTGTSNESNGPAAIACQWSNVDIDGNTITGNGAAGDQTGIVFESTNSNVDPDGASATNNTLNDLLKGIDTNGHSVTTSPNTFNNCGTNVETT